MYQGVFGYDESNDVTAIFVTWPEVTSRVVGLRLEGSLVNPVTLTLTR